MPPTLRTRSNAQGSKTVASTGSKRKRNGTPHLPSEPVPKKRRGKKTADAVPDNRTACQKAADHEKIIKKLRIKFHPHIFRPQRPGEVPKQHQTKFTHIQQLGKMIYESYAVQPRPDIINKPWELMNKKRAEQISHKAILSRDGYQNEDTWRMNIEPYIFARFETEVAWYDRSETDLLKML
jgi:hypothetical protein